MHQETRRFLLFSAMFVAFSATPLFAQTFGEIAGRISDSSGAAIPGANVFLTNTATNAVRTAVSTVSGDYTFPAVSPGVYNIRAEQAAFKTATANNVQLQVQQSLRLDFTLQVGSVSESIEVAASAEMLQTGNAAVGSVIENKSIVELPLNGRNYLNLVALSANVNVASQVSGQAAGRQGGDRANQVISVGGNRIMFVNYTLDGVTNTDPNFSTYVTLPSIDAIQEFKVQTGVYPAEFGHQSTQINVVTKSGGNAYHGALFEFVRNDRFDAKPYSFTSAHVKKSPFKWNDYGFELDGPVRIPKLFDGRDRLFFMVNYEWKVQRRSSQGVYTVPTAKMFDGDFSELPVTVYDPATKAPFPNNRIPSTMMDPISRKFLNYYKSSNLPGLTSNYVQMNSSPNNRDGLTLRMDFVESMKSQWTGRYSWGDENESSTYLSIAGSKLLTNYEQYLGTNTRTLTPTLVNEARFGYTRLYNSTGTRSAFDVDTVSAMGIPNLKAGDPVSWGVPYASFAGSYNYAYIGDAQDGPYAIDDNTLQLVDNLSWVKGKHSFRFGFEYTRQNFNQIGNQFSRGQFSTQEMYTKGPDGKGGNAFAEFLLGDLYTTTVAVALAKANFQRNSYHFFVDDTYKLTPKLTLTLGLRYEITPPWVNQLNNQFSAYVPGIYALSSVPDSVVPFMVRQGNCSDPYDGINIRWTTVNAVCSNGLLPDALMNTSYRDWAPRIGLAYSPDAKTVVRVAAGVFYNQDIGNAFFDLARNTGGRINYVATSSTPITFATAVPGAGAYANVPSPYAYSMARSHKTPYVMQYLFNIQREMARNWAFELGYLGSQSRHLQGFQDANQGIPTTESKPQRPYKGFSNIQYVHDSGSGNYNSLSFKATRRFSQGMSVVSSYTWSKSIDTTSGIRNQGNDTLYPQNSYCLACERGLSAFDTRHRMVAAVLYDLPVGKDKFVRITNPILNAIAGGWNLGGTFTLQSGMPGNLTIGGQDNARTGSGGYDRPNVTGASPYLDKPTPSKYFNSAAFAKAPQGQFGNAARNLITGPGIIGLDAEIHKTFKMPYKEGHQIQFRFEAFNALNHPNWLMPNLNTTSSAFGTITATRSMREIQLGLKYGF